MSQVKRYCMLHIPESGLFHHKGHFHDGDGNGIAWDGTIPVFKSRQAADTYKKQRKGGFIILGFEPIEKGTDK